MKVSTPNPHNLLMMLHEDSSGTYFEEAQLRHVKEGTEFRRKLNAKSSFIRNHYNRKNAYGTESPASFSCTDAEYPWGGREIFLKPSTIVFVEINT